MTSTETLSKLAEQYWDVSMASDPTSAQLLGDHRFDGQMEDVSRANEDELIGSYDAVAEAAAAIDPSELDREDQRTLRVLMFAAETSASSRRTRGAEFAMDPNMGFHVQLFTNFPKLPLTEPDHATALVAKYREVGKVFDETANRLREGDAAKRTAPRVACGKVLKQILKYLATPIDEDALLDVKAPPGMDASAEAAWRADLRDAVIDEIRPGFARYGETIAELLPNARPPKNSGVCWLPDGESFYAEAAHRHTSTNRTPEEIHQIGLDEIERLADEYRELGPSALGTSDLAEIFTRLRTDQSLRFDDADQIQAAAEQTVADAKAAIGDWFGRLPKAECIVEPIPAVSAPDATLAYYLPPSTDGSRPGTYFVNRYNPTSRPRFQAQALAFHEAIPGHHLQLSIAKELEGIPTFRMNAQVTAYSEGWGLYAERLADEMGLYAGDLERMGILQFDSWRACRLVVDTGIHQLGWSREQAIQYMRDNSPVQENNIVNEIDRYIAWPGQALAYKIGQLEILRARDVAKKALGADFDIKGFHDAVLETGPVPLDLLADVVNDWATSR